MNGRRAKQLKRTARAMATTPAYLQYRGRFTTAFYPAQSWPRIYRRLKKIVSRGGLR